MAKLSVKIEVITPADLIRVAEVLSEAAKWLEEQGMAFWNPSELSAESVRRNVEAGYF